LAEAVGRALVFEDREFAETRWSDALSASPRPAAYGGIRVGSRLIDSRTCAVDAPAKAAFAAVRRIGGANGWYWGNWLWRIRGLIDLAAGGAGLRRGRRDPTSLAIGDPLDFWRVEALEDGRLLRLAAEMKLPGRAWLEFEVTPAGGDRSTIRQTAMFDAYGLRGLMYWYGLYPIHALIFRQMLRGIARRASTHRSPPPQHAASRAA
jgi:hypothetical protein